MRRLFPFLLAWVLWPTAGQGADIACDIPTYEGRYCRFMVEGWTLELSASLVRQSPSTASAALNALNEDLRAIRDRFPVQRVAELRRIFIWVERETPNLSRQRLTYYTTTSKSPVDLGFPAGKNGSIDLSSADYYLRARKFQPSVISHELAHAYHDLILGADDPRIETAYRTALESGTYMSVMRNNGSREKAYALTNNREYFAELTEAFFGTNDFFPFTRADLQSHDPTGFEAVRTVWHDTAPVAFRESRGSRCKSNMIASPRSKQRTRLTIRNGRADPIRLVWIDFKGERSTRLTIAPGALGTLYSFVGHNFAVMDAEEQCLTTETAQGAVLWIDVLP